MAVVVSDTSPIRALAHLGLLDVLPRFFSEVVLPPAVIGELEQPRKRFRPVLLMDIPSARCVAPTDRAAVDSLKMTLDAGEAEAIVLAVEIGAVRILMDEADGRAEAVRRGLRPIGALGVLVRAKRLRLIDAIAPRIERLQRELGFFVADAVKDRALKQAREA